MAWWNRSRRTVDIDALTPEDRAWLEQEADRIAVDPVTFVRMLIRRSRTEAATKIGVAYGRPGFVADLPSTSELVAATREWEERSGRGEPERPPDIDVEALLEAELANAEQLTAPPAASNGAVQVVGGRPPAPFHIPRGMG